MKQLFVLFMLPVIIGCGHKIIANFSPSMTTEKEYRVGVVSDNILADAIASELLRYGFVIVERARIVALVEELKLSMTGLLLDDNLRKVGNILSIDAMIFVKTDDSSGVINSASIKIVDIETGVLLGGVNFQNTEIKWVWNYHEPLPSIARKIAKEIAKGFGKLSK